MKMPICILGDEFIEYMVFTFIARPSVPELTLRDNVIEQDLQAALAAVP
jgi:hypothetical protein